MLRYPPGRGFVWGSGMAAVQRRLGLVAALAIPVRWMGAACPGTSRGDVRAVLFGVWLLVRQVAVQAGDQHLQPSAHVARFERGAHRAVGGDDPCEGEGVEPVE